MLDPSDAKGLKLSEHGVNTVSYAVLSVPALCVCTCETTQLTRPFSLSSHCGSDSANAPPWALFHKVPPRSFFAPTAPYKTAIRYTRPLTWLGMLRPDSGVYTEPLKF